MPEGHLISLSFSARETRPFPHLRDSGLQGPFRVSIPDRASLPSPLSGFLPKLLEIFEAGVSLSCKSRPHLIGIPFFSFFSWRHPPPFPASQFFRIYSYPQSPGHFSVYRFWCASLLAILWDARASPPFFLRCFTRTFFRARARFST